jgi:hypothetical protein
MKRVTLNGLALEGKTTELQAVVMTEDLKGL